MIAPFFYFYFSEDRKQMYFMNILWEIKGSINEPSVYKMYFPVVCRRPEKKFLTF